MDVANVYEAKTHLSRLLRRVRAGEEIIIADAGRPIARLVPILPAPGPRVLGGDEDLVSIADDFDAPLPDEIMDAFYGGGEAGLPLPSPPKTRRKSKKPGRAKAVAKPPKRRA